MQAHRAVRRLRAASSSVWLLLAVGAPMAAPCCAGGPGVVSPAAALRMTIVANHFPRFVGLPIRPTTSGTADEWSLPLTDTSVSHLFYKPIMLRIVPLHFQSQTFSRLLIHKRTPFKRRPSLVRSGKRF